MCVKYSTYLFACKRPYVPCRALLSFVHLDTQTNEAQLSQAQINRGDSCRGAGGVVCSALQSCNTKSISCYLECFDMILRVRE